MHLTCASNMSIMVKKERLFKILPLPSLKGFNPFSPHPQSPIRALIRKEKKDRTGLCTRFSAVHIF